MGLLVPPRFPRNFPSPPDFGHRGDPERAFVKRSSLGGGEDRHQAGDRPMDGIVDGLAPLGTGSDARDMPVYSVGMEPL